MKCTNPYMKFDRVERRFQMFPCGQCYNCRATNRFNWSVRMIHELPYHNNKAVFVTLTYDNEHLPANESVSVRDTQLFFKQLRHGLCRKYGNDFRIMYFQCGEYGSISKRPHYHSIIFGLGHDSFINSSKRPHTSAYFDYQKIGKDFVVNKGLLTKAWDKGRIVIGFDVLQKCMSYVSGYIHSKLTGDLAVKVYEETGRASPFMTASKGIGRRHILDNADHYRSTLCMSIKGFRFALPRYARTILGITSHDLADDIYKHEKEMVDDFLSRNPNKSAYFYTNNSFVSSADVIANFNEGIPDDKKTERLKFSDLGDYSRDFRDFMRYRAKLLETDRKARIEVGISSKASVSRDWI